MTGTGSERHRPPCAPFVEFHGVGALRREQVVRRTVAESAVVMERKRQRVQVAARIASALIGVYAKQDPEIVRSGVNSLALAGETQRLTDAVLQKLYETEGN
jgi:hypothetical protein